ncbi:MAG: response regulator transcription factor [Frankia sp.]
MTALPPHARGSESKETNETNSRTDRETGSGPAGRDAGAAPGRTPKPPVRAMPPSDPRGISLGSTELRGVLRIVEDCERAPTLPVFRQTALEGLARHLGYRHGAFFVGSSLELAFQDRDPAGHGIGLQMAEAFLERYRTLDAFIEPDNLNVMRERGLLTFEEFGLPGRPEIRMYLQQFLKVHGIRAKMLVRLTTPTGVGGFVSLSDQRPRAFGPRDRAVCALVGRHLGNLLRFHLQSGPVPSVTTKLSARERDVVRLVADGSSNRQIAEALCISVDTVKHHVRRAMEATGCANRTQLALAWQREVRAPLLVGPAVAAPPATRL